MLLLTDHTHESHSIIVESLLHSMALLELNILHADQGAQLEVYASDLYPTGLNLHDSARSHR